MPSEAINLACPSCGAPASTGQKTCEFCQRPIIITSFNSVNSLSMPELNKYSNAYKKVLLNNPDSPIINASIAMCYMKLKLYDKAASAFEKAIEADFDNSELYFYACICLLGNKKPYLHTRDEIDKIMSYLDSAIMIEPRGIYYYFQAYIKKDYFARKFFACSPTWQETIQLAKEHGLTQEDIRTFSSLLGVAGQ